MKRTKAKIEKIQKGFSRANVEMMLLFEDLNERLIGLTPAETVGRKGTVLAEVISELEVAINAATAANKKLAAAKRAILPSP